MSTLVPIFTAKVTQGQIVMDDPRRLKLHLCRFKDGATVEVTVRRPSKKRSDNQNGYYWGVVIDLIHAHTGEKADVIHGILASEFLTRTGWQGKPYVKSTTTLTTVEFEKYLEDCRRWAAVALEIYIPLPNEVEIPEYQAEAV